VTAVSGQATLVNAQGDQPVKLGMRPLLGDELAVAGGKVSLVFSAETSFPSRTASASSSVRRSRRAALTTGSGTRGLGEDDATPVGSKRPGPWQAADASGRRSSHRFREFAATACPSPSLRVWRVAGENPRFYWFDTDTSGEGSERGYLIVVKNEENTVIARQQVRGTAGRLNSFRFERPPQGLRGDGPHALSVEQCCPTARPCPKESSTQVSCSSTRRGWTKRADRCRGSTTCVRRVGLDETSYHMLQCSLLLDERERTVLRRTAASACARGDTRRRGIRRRAARADCSSASAIKCPHSPRCSYTGPAPISANETKAAFPPVYSCACLRMHPRSPACGGDKRCSRGRAHHGKVARSTTGRNSTARKTTSSQLRRQACAMRTICCSRRKRRNGSAAFSSLMRPVRRRIAAHYQTQSRTARRAGFRSGDSLGHIHRPHLVRRAAERAQQHGLCTRTHGASTRKSAVPQCLCA
jgi:hypothetical protein